MGPGPRATNTQGTHPLSVINYHNTMYKSLDLRTIDGTRHDDRAILSSDALSHELMYLRPHDPVKRIMPGTVPGTYRIVTAGHGYTAVPFTHTWEREARAVCSYGYTGKLAVYLDADYEAPSFADRVHKREAVHSLQATRVQVQLA